MHMYVEREGMRFAVDKGDSLTELELPFRWTVFGFGSAGAGTQAEADALRVEVTEVFPGKHRNAYYVSCRAPTPERERCKLAKRGATLTWGCGDDDTLAAAGFHYTWQIIWSGYANKYVLLVRVPSGRGTDLDNYYLRTSLPADWQDQLAADPTSLRPTSNFVEVLEDPELAVMLGDLLLDEAR